jgi:peptide/nickel transport system substrate-binding protein
MAVGGVHWWRQTLWAAEAILAALVCLCALASPAPARAQNTPAGPPAYGDSLVIGSIGDATSMIPMLTADSASHEIGEWCYNGLLKYDKNLNLTGDLAESWEVSSDGLTITFCLREGVCFHDGHPYTSADALFNWRFMTDPKTPTPYAGDYLKVKGAETPDQRTFRVTYAEPFAPGLASWSLPQLPAHLLEGQDPRQSPLNRAPVGTGPYRFKQWLPGSQVELVAFANYWEGRPYLDSLVYRVIPDMATLFLELRSGGVDWMGLTPLQYRRQTETDVFRRDFRKYRYLASAYTYIAWNLRDPRFADPRVRQAFSYAINVDELIKGVLLGLGRPATGPLKPDTYYYNLKVKTYTYNPVKARELLAQAGWLPGADGRLMKYGRPLEFVLLTNQGNQSRQNAGVIIQRRLAEIGVKVELRTIEWAALIKEFVDKGRFEAVLLGWTITQYPDQYDIWHSSSIGPGKLNFSSYHNPEVDRLLVEGRRLFDPVQRKAVYDRLQELLAEDVPYTFLYVPDALPMVHARFQGIEQPAPAAGIGYNFIKWYVPQTLQKPALTQ